MRWWCEINVRVTEQRNECKYIIREEKDAEYYSFFLQMFIWNALTKINTEDPYNLDKAPWVRGEKYVPKQDIVSSIHTTLFGSTSSTMSSSSSHIIPTTKNNMSGFTERSIHDSLCKQLDDLNQQMNAMDHKLLNQTEQIVTALLNLKRSNQVDQNMGDIFEDIHQLVLEKIERERLGYLHDHYETMSNRNLNVKIGGDDGDSYKFSVKEYPEMQIKEMISNEYEKILSDAKLTDPSLDQMKMSPLFGEHLKRRKFNTNTLQHVPLLPPPPPKSITRSEYNSQDSMITTTTTMMTREEVIIPIDELNLFDRSISDEKKKK